MALRLVHRGALALVVLVAGTLAVLEVVLAPVIAVAALLAVVGCHILAARQQSAFARLVSEHEQTERSSRKRDQNFRELADTISEVFWLSDPENRTMHYISPAYERVYGRTCAALYANARDWLAAVHPDDRERMAAFVGPGEAAYRIVRPDGAVRSIAVRVFPVRDEAGAVIRLAGVGSDVTEKLELEAQLRQTQKLESIGLLAGGIAHDFNNILAVVAANTGMLAESVTGPLDRELVDEVEAAVRRGTSLTRQLLAFSRKQVADPVVLDVNAAVNDTRKMLRRMVGDDIVLETSFEPELGCIRLDPGHFVQILMNLAVNARDAMPRGGTLALTTRRRGGDVAISIADTGCGMSPEVVSHIFEPFFTTKGVGKGTGLGLAVVHGIVVQAGGRLEVESEVGIGTTFRILLPWVDAPADPIASVAAAGAAGTERIVLVDDDLFVRRSTSRALRARGYAVLEAADGQTALRLLRDHGPAVSLLVTDVVMPGMDGCELAQAARAHRPSLKVLFMTGYADDAAQRHGVDHTGAGVLEKPVRAHVLAGRVRQVLDAA